jgi:hypothetical protein
LDVRNIFLLQGHILSTDGDALKWFGIFFWMIVLLVYIFEKKKKKKKPPIKHGGAWGI